MTSTSCLTPSIGGILVLTVNSSLLHLPAFFVLQNVPYAVYSFNTNLQEVWNITQSKPATATDTILSDTASVSCSILG